MGSVYNCTLLVQEKKPQNNHDNKKKRKQKTKPHQNSVNINSKSYRVWQFGGCGSFLSLILQKLYSPLHTVTAMQYCITIPMSVADKGGGCGVEAPTLIQ